MSNDIKKSADTAVATATNVAENLLRYGRGAANRTFIGDLMLFSKYGEYRAGQDKLEIPLKSRFSVYIDSFCIGWQRWEDGRVVEQEMGPVTGGYIPRARKDLGHLDKSKWESFEDGREKDPWAFTNTIVFVSSDKDSPKFYTFSTTSKGGIGALGKLAIDCGEHLRQKPGESAIIELNRSSYPHPDYGEVRIPVINIVGWMQTKDLPPIEGDSSSSTLLADQSAATPDY